MIFWESPNRAIVRAITELKDYKHIKSDWDRQKAFDLEAHMAVTTTQNVINKSSQGTEIVSHISKDTEDAKHEIKLQNKDIYTNKKVKDKTYNASEVAVSKHIYYISTAKTDNFDKMDTVFAENMSLMEEISSSFNVNEVFQSATDKYITHLRTEATSFKTGAITNIKRESDKMISKVSNQFRDDTTIADMRDSIILDIKQCQYNTSNDNLEAGDKITTYHKNASRDITQAKYQVDNANTLLNIASTNAIESLKDTKANTIIDNETYKNTAIQELQ